MDNNSKPCPDYYNEHLDTSDIDLHDDQDIVRLLVNNFVRRQRYEDHIGALQDVTPNQWRTQVNRAAMNLEEELGAILGTQDEKLHNGEFADPVKDKG